MTRPAESPSAPPLAPLDEIEARYCNFTEALALCAALRAERAERERYREALRVCEMATGFCSGTCIRGYQAARAALSGPTTEEPNG